MATEENETIELGDKAESPDGIIREVTAIRDGFAELGMWEWFPIEDLKLVSKQQPASGGGDSAGKGE